jgi:hypothetical protein
MTQASARRCFARTAARSFARRTLLPWAPQPSTRLPASSAARPEARVRSGASPIANRSPNRGLSYIAVAILASLAFVETSAAIGDWMVGAMLTLILVLPLARIFARNSADDRRRS